jgi:hypothetical protein
MVQEMTQILDSAFRGLMVGNQQYDRNRSQNAQERAARLMTTGDRSGAARELMAAGQFGEAATMSNVSMVNAAQDARQRAGEAARGGNFTGASAELYGNGDIEGGGRLEGEARNREAGAALVSDPTRAAAIQAAGGNIEQATQIIDWSQRADESERAAVLNRTKIMAPILHRAAGLPYEQRRAFIAQNAQVLGSAGFTPEQLTQFDPSDDNIRALSDTALGFEAVLGSYSQRVVGDEVRTYRTNPYGVERTGSEAVPYSRDEARDDKRLELEEDRVGIAREQLTLPNSTGDIYAPLLARYARGEQLSPQETEIVQSILSRGQGGDDFSAPLPGVPQPAPMVGPNGAAPANRSGITPGAATPPQAAGGMGTRQNPARPRTPQEAASLPSGAFFVDPSGAIRQRP